MAAARPAKAAAQTTAPSAVPAGTGTGTGTGAEASSEDPSTSDPSSTAAPAAPPTDAGANVEPSDPASTSSSAHPQAASTSTAPSTSSDLSRRGTAKRRVAAIDTEEANRPRIEDLSLTTPASARPFDSSGGLICLCAPEPKVPRPRNAFILYRQHYQAQVVQQHPGLANPEISKIIGEQWRDEPEERKQQWKQLAEEEKQHHQRKYPDYRYQPRRGNKSGAGQSGRGAAGGTGVPGEDPSRCPKCHGRYIATPRTPSTPFPTPTTARPPQAPIAGSSQSASSSLSSRTSSRPVDMGRHPHTRANPPPPSWSGPASSPMPPSYNSAGQLYDIPENRQGPVSPHGSSKRRRYNQPPSSGSSINTVVHPAPCPQPSLAVPSPPLGMYPLPSSRHHSYPSQHPSTPIYPPPPPQHVPPGPSPAPISAAAAQTMQPPPPGPPYMLPRSSPGPDRIPPTPSYSRSSFSHSLPPPGPGGYSSYPTPGLPPGPPSGGRPSISAGGSSIGSSLSMGSTSTEYPHSSSGSYYHHHQSPYPPPYQRTPHPSGGKPEFDESLRLPPLQTHQLGSPHSPEIGESSGISASSAGMRRGGSGVSMVGSGPSGVGPGAAPGPSSAGGPPPIENTGSGLGLGILHPTGPAGFQSWSSSSSSSHRPPAANHSPNPAQREHEALVMSIPFVNKLRVLGRISPPLRTGVGRVHGGGTSRLERGPVIAIEGPDSKLVNAVAVVVERAIKEAAPPPVDGTGTWEVRCWEDDGLGGGAGGDAGSGRDATEGKDGEDVVMAEVGAEEDEPSRHQRRGSQVTTRASITTATAAGKEPDIINKDGNPFVTYLHTILNWHAKSAEIIQFVTGNDTPTTTAIRTSLASTPSSSSIPTPTPTPTVATQSQSQPQPLQQQHHQQRHSTSTTASATTTSQETSERINISTVKTPNPPTSSSASDDVSPSAVNIPTNQSNTKNKTLPIALLPSGFSLTLSDRFACSVPITDAYEAVDHWQWMATLWRGIVGADLVVYVHSSAATDGGERGAPGGGVLGTETSGSVEVRNASLMVVKVPLGTAVAANIEGPQGVGAVLLDDKIERRLGFEVVEWVRSGGWVTGERQRLASGWEY